MNYQARQYGRDGDTYGRHALVNPGGDNVQRDIGHVLPRGMSHVGLHPTRFNPDYIGRHRATGEAWRTVSSVAERVARGFSLVGTVTVDSATWFNR